MSTEAELYKWIKNRDTIYDTLLLTHRQSSMQLSLLYNSLLQMSEAVSNAIQIWISAVLCKFDSNYVCITEL